MNDTGFIFLLSLGAALLSGIVGFAHLSSRNLSRRIADRRARAAANEPELDFDHDYRFEAADLREPVMHAGASGHRF